MTIQPRSLQPAEAATIAERVIRHLLVTRP